MTSDSVYLPNLLEKHSLESFVTELGGIIHQEFSMVGFLGQGNDSIQVGIVDHTDLDWWWNEEDFESERKEIETIMGCKPQTSILILHGTGHNAHKVAQWFIAECGARWRNACWDDHEGTVLPIA
jgi:hypothetical protein